MLDHYLQRDIVYRLAFLPSARFSELKPDDIENKLFTYHLKKVVGAGYVEKSDDGLYALTAEGRRLGYQAVKSDRFLLDKAYSVLFLISRRKLDGAWLVSRRAIHPLFGYKTFPVATPTADVDLATAASRDLLAKTGLRGTFAPLGGGYCRVYQNAELESYTHFTLMVCDDVQGELVQQDVNAHYEWAIKSDFSSSEFLPDIPRLVELYEQGKPFFVEEDFTL